jgi:hypothetical protein
MNDFITSEDISWSNCVGICTDGAAVLTEHKKGFQVKYGKLLLTKTLYIASLIERI